MTTVIFYSKTTKIYHGYVKHGINGQWMPLEKEEAEKELENGEWYKKDDIAKTLYFRIDKEEIQMYERIYKQYYSHKTTNNESRSIKTRRRKR